VLRSRALGTEHQDQGLRNKASESEPGYQGQDIWPRASGKMSQSHVLRARASGLGPQCQGFRVGPQGQGVRNSGPSNGIYY